jgi:hypothetical protein
MLDEIWEKEGRTPNTGNESIDSYKKKNRLLVMQLIGFAVSLLLPLPPSMNEKEKKCAAHRMFHN